MVWVLGADKTIFLYSAMDPDKGKELGKGWENSYNSLKFIFNIISFYLIVLYFWVQGYLKLLASMYVYSKIYQLETLILFVVLVLFSFLMLGRIYFAIAPMIMYNR